VPGCRGENGNACPDGEVCTSVDETIGECIPESDGGTGGTGGAGGAGGTGGVGGAGGTSGTGGTAGTGATGGMGGTGAMGGTGGASGTGGGADAGTDEEGVLEGGGCSCTVPGSGSAPLGLGLMTVLAGLLGLRSRRRPQ
jgi:MYXO-CTERM domain-containing protein